MKTKIMKKSPLIIMGLGLLLVFLGGFTNWQGEPWEVPDNYQKMKNPIASDDNSISIGKALYSKHCKSCHGKEGLGDGPKSEQLDTPSGDFTTDESHAQSDGSLFYKTREGRDDMPTFKKKIPLDEDVWHLVNYMRTLE